MIAAWMLYAALVTLLAGIAGAIGERALRLVRGPSRFAWAVAILVSLAIPLAALTGVWSGRSVGALAPVIVGSDGAASLASAASAVQGRAAGFDTLLLLLWGGVSLVALLALAYSLGAARRVCDSSVELTVDGVPVLLSVEHGPAVTGLVTPRIVIPRWVLSLDPPLRELVLLHEREHARGGDPWLVTLGTIATVALPWNLPLWWMVRRLRLAVEMDCDDRVLRARPDVRRYGSLLLAVTQRATRSLTPLSTTLVERPSQLERRITAMTAALPSRPVATSLTLGALAMLVAFVACEAPSPTADAGAPKPQIVAPGTTFFEFQVEEPVVQAPGSAGPRYPDILRQAGVEGEVLAQFVVDENGVPDVTSFKVLRSSHDLFSKAVEGGLANMKFVSAKVGGRAVKQLVQQPFTFQISKPDVMSGQPIRPGSTPATMKPAER
jgi:TonB family protein